MIVYLINEFRLAFIDSKSLYGEIKKHCEYLKIRLVNPGYLMN